MEEYTCNDWSEVPNNLKTKTSLNEMGIFNLCKVSATANVYGKIINIKDANPTLHDIMSIPYLIVIYLLT